MIRNYQDGTSVVHEISDIKRTAIGSTEPVGRNNFPMNGGSKSSDTSIVPQNSDNVNNGITKLADMGYDVSSKVGSKAKKVAKKAADIANEHPLGGTTKLDRITI